MSGESEIQDLPMEVGELAARAVQYVEKSVGVTLSFDSETLPILDHYLSTVADASVEAAELIAVCAGAYFGEVVRRCVGGSWKTTDTEALSWRLILPGGMWFLPAHVALAAIRRTDEFNDDLNPPAKMVTTATDALARMGDVTANDYYSLCGRFDTLEHLQSVLLAIAADEVQRREKAN